MGIKLDCLRVEKTYIQQLRKSVLVNELGPHNPSQKEGNEEERREEKKDEEKEERREKDKSKYFPDHTAHRFLN